MSNNEFNDSNSIVHAQILMRKYEKLQQENMALRSQLSQYESELEVLPLLTSNIRKLVGPPEVAPVTHPTHEEIPHEELPPTKLPPTKELPPTKLPPTKDLPHTKELPHTKLPPTRDLPHTTKDFPP